MDTEINKKKTGSQYASVNNCVGSGRPANLQKGMRMPVALFEKQDSRHSIHLASMPRA